MSIGINIRKYGAPPFKTALLHGGPGAPGGMAPVARRLSARFGVLEPLQSAQSLEGQINELAEQLREASDRPVTLAGSSWGAMLGFMFAARFPEMVRKLILIGSGVFEEKYAVNIMKTRMERLTPAQILETNRLMEIFRDPSVKDKKDAFEGMGKIFTAADAFDPMTLDTEVLEGQFEVHVPVWRDAQELRASGELLAMGKKIRCPVLALHGDYDPHPAEGVRVPLQQVLTDFRFVLLKNCGHLPWLERRAAETFWEQLERELSV